MTTAQASLILLGEPHERLQIEELEPSISVYTGAALRQIAFTATIEGEDDHERLNNELTAASNDKTFTADTTGIRWKVIRRSRTGSGPMVAELSPGRSHDADHPGGTKT